MRRIDWSPLVVLVCALAAVVIASALPESFPVRKETAAVILWVPMVLIVLKVIRVIRLRQIRRTKLREVENKDLASDSNRSG